MSMIEDMKASAAETNLRCRVLWGDPNKGGGRRETGKTKSEFLYWTIRMLPPQEIAEKMGVTNARISTLRSELGMVRKTPAQAAQIAQELLD